MNRYECCGKSAHYECPNETTEARGGVNCCIVGFMAKCGAGPLVVNQRACRFFRMSSAGNRCMHYCVALDGHCDSIDAQQEMKNREPSRN
jgi:hypothetical protein